MTSEQIRKMALQCGAVEIPFSTALATESLDIQKFTNLILQYVVEDISTFSSDAYGALEDPLADANSQGYNDAIEQVVDHLRENYLNLNN